MKRTLFLVFLSAIVLTISCSPSSQAVVDEVVATEFTDTREAEETIAAPEASTPKAVAQTLVATMAPTAAETTICALYVSEGDFYEIIEGPYITDDICDTVIPSIQAELNVVLNANPTVTRVTSYPTSPVICNKVPVGRSFITVVDVHQSEISQGVCDSFAARSH
jgi:hypothetical protein